MIAEDTNPTSKTAVTQNAGPGPKYMRFCESGLCFLFLFALYYSSMYMLQKVLYAPNMQNPDGCINSIAL